MLFVSFIFVLFGAVAYSGDPTANAYGSKIHVSGSTKVKDNYNGAGAASANIGVHQAKTSGTGEFYNASTVVIVEPDFTGEIHIVKTNQGNFGHSTTRRGLVFFRGSSYDENGEYIRNGIVFHTTLNQYAKASEGELVNFCGDDTSIQGTWLTAVSKNPAPFSLASITLRVKVDIRTRL